MGDKYNIQGRYYFFNESASISARCRHPQGWEENYGKTNHVGDVSKACI